MITEIVEQYTKTLLKVTVRYKEVCYYCGIALPRIIVFVPESNLYYAICQDCNVKVFAARNIIGPFSPSQSKRVEEKL